MAKTTDDLKQAFAGESQANRKYLAFATRADQEGYKQAARLFRAAAEAETIHAHAHLKVLGGNRSTKENLDEAIAGESFEFTSMYPEMIVHAQAEGNKDAERSFRWANEVEKIHAGLYRKMVADLGKTAEDYPYYVCPLCGNTVEKNAPEECPICGTKGKAFKKVE